MATFAELYGLFQDSVLLNRVTAACAAQAEVIRLELGTVQNHVNRLKWAKEAYTDPAAKARQVIWALLAANAAGTPAAIQGATDAAILTAVANAVDIFATG